MSPTTFVRWNVVLAGTAAGLAVFAWAQTPIPEKQPSEVKPISVASFAEQLPVGYLGVPLGTVVRVTGEAVDGSTTGAKSEEGKTLLRIGAVNGKELARPVVFEFLRATESVKKPAAGQKFDYYVHEYGEFDGQVIPPKELGIKTVVVASTGFHYRRYVTVHATNAGRK